MTRDELESGGPPIRLSVLAGILGVSRDKLINDAERGEFETLRIKCGRHQYRHVQRDEALRYLERIGFRW